MNLSSPPSPPNLLLKISKDVRRRAEPEDGTRILTMRYWPRGVRKDHIDEWRRELAPSPELLRWCWDNKDRVDFQEYSATWMHRYREEMEERVDLIEGLRTRLGNGETLTLLCACHKLDDCHRLELAKIICGHNDTA